MSFLYNFPSQTAFGKVVSKSKIYENASPGSKVRELFVKQVEKIIWSNKLSPETINLKAKDGVREIQVFNIASKTKVLKHDVLRTIDKAIPSPILFALSYKGKTKYVASYKRKSEVDKKKWVVSSYFETQWFDDSSKHIELPVALDMSALYGAILKSIIPLRAKKNETLNELVIRCDTLEMLKRELGKATARMKRTKQFNRKVEINAELKKLNKKIKELQS